MKRTILALTVAISVAIGTIDRADGSSGNWPQFRGPQATGVDESAALPTTWNIKSGENIPWRTPIPGLGHSSPIIWQDRIYVATAVKPGGKADLKVGLYGAPDSYKEQEPHQWRLLCLQKATGSVLWNQLAHEAVPRLARHTKASHCNSTPATDGQRIVAIFGSEGLFCFDTNGQKLWHRDLGKMDAGPPGLPWGFASSPVLHEGKVMVQCDVLSEHFLAAYDLKDGREHWRTQRRELGGSWCTPTIAISERGPQILVNGWKHIGGFDSNTGRELWWMSEGGDVPVPTPVIAHGLVFLTSAHGKFRPLRAVRLNAEGNITPPQVGDTNASVVWAHARQGSYMQTPIVIGDLLYGCHDTGVLTCFEARTGDIHYSERLSSGGGKGFSASPVSDGRHLYFPSELGEVYVVPAGKKFSVVATNNLEEICMASPAISEGTLFFRTREHLIAVGKRQ